MWQGNRVLGLGVSLMLATAIAGCGSSDSSDTRDDKPERPGTSVDTVPELRLGAPDYDIRGVFGTTLERPRIVLSATRQRVLDDLAGAQPGTLTVRYSELTDFPSRLTRLGPALTAPSDAPSRSIARQFLERYSAIFGLSSSDLADAYFSRDFVTVQSGARHLTVQFRAADRDVFGSALRLSLDAEGRIASASGQPIPYRDQIAPGSETVSESEAVASAASAALVENVGESSVKGLLYFPLSKDELRPAWDLTFRDGNSPFRYRSLVDAVDGRVLWRRALTFSSHIPTHGSVYMSDSPDPNTPVGSSAGIVPRQDVPFHGGDFFPHDDVHFDWWADGDRSTTTSNNVDAYADRDADNVPDPGSRPTAGTGEDFTFPLDLTQDPSTYQDAAVANLFHRVNRLHDYFYGIGFDEVSGNFQTDNLGFAGSGGDAVMAEAQDGADADPRTLCNAFMSSDPTDGLAPRLFMFQCTNATPERDGDLDNVVIGHEYGHGVHTRLVNISGNQQTGEGWADYFALSSVAEDDDPYDGGYGIGNWEFNDFNGIRSAPYSTDEAAFGLSYANIRDGARCRVGTCSSDDTETCFEDDDCSTDGDDCELLACEFHEDCEPPNTDFSRGPCQVRSPHFVGSIWSNALHITRFNMIAKFGFPAGLVTVDRLVIEGMKHTADDPTFVDSRNGLLEADQVHYDGAHQCLIWDAFAKMGVGASALTTGVDDINPIEAFDMPTVCSPVIQVNAPARFDNTCVGDNVTQTLEIFNTGGGELIVTEVERISGSSDIVVDPNPELPVFIGADSHVNFTVRCIPTAGGNATATIRIRSNDPTTPVKDIVYTCERGIADINTAIADSGDFGQVCAGDHADLAVTLFNQGSCNLSITSVSLIPPSGSFELPEDLDLPLVLSHDADFTLPIRFSPEFCSDLPEDAILRLLTNDPDEPIVDIDLSGVSPCPRLVIDPPSLDETLAFPATVVDSTGILGCFSEQRLNVRNTGACPLVIDSISAEGLANALDYFVIEPSVFPITLPGGEETLGVTVRFTPQLDASPTVPTSVLGELVVESNDPDGTVAADLCGEAVTQSGVRILVTQVSSGTPVPIASVDRITLQSKGVSQPGPINFAFNDQPLSSSMVCGNLVRYHVDQETLPTSETTGSNPGSSYEASAKEGSLQTTAQFSLAKCEFKSIQLEVRDPGAPGCALLPNGSSCLTDGECCSGQCRGPNGGKTCGP